MSEKDRRKKAQGQKNRAMRDENPRAQKASPPHQAKDESNLTDTQPGADQKRGW
jgi:hypothetical protein